MTILPSVYMGLTESPLRGYKETPLRALLIGHYKIDKLYAMVNTMSTYCGQYGLGYVDEIYPVPFEYIFNYYSPATNIFDSIVLNCPIQGNIGDVFNATVPEGEGSTLAIGWWFNQFVADLVGWSGKPIDQWSILPPGGFSVENNKWLNNQTTVIKGLAIWPALVCGYGTITNYEYIQVTKKQRLGASLTLLKQGITGIITLHDVVTRPIGDWTQSLVSPVSGTGSQVVNILADTPQYAVIDPDNVNGFACPADKVMCFWIGKTFAEVAAMLPNSGAPDYTPIPFNPWTYGLLSSYNTFPTPYQ